MKMKQLIESSRTHAVSACSLYSISLASSCRIAASFSKSFLRYSLVSFADISLVFSSLTCNCLLFRAACTAENVESANAGDLGLCGDLDLQ